MLLPPPCHATVLFALLSGAAHAQTEVLTQSLACLAKPEKPPTYPKRHSLDRGDGGMRVMLSFTKPDASPQVEVLFNSAREDMQDEVHRYLRHYRLPCRTDPNKLPFLSWLASLQLALKNAEQADHLFGSQLQIDIPCGTLNLSGAD